MKVTIKEQEFSIEKISLDNQFHVARALSPVLTALAPVLISANKGGDLLSKDADSFKPFADCLASMKKEDADFCLFALLSKVQKKENKGLGWSNVVDSEAKVFQYQDMSLTTILMLAYKSLHLSLKDAFEDLPLASQEVDTKPKG